MVSSRLPLSRKRVVAFLALALGIGFSETALAAGATGSPAVVSSAIVACSTACVAQQSLASAIHSPLRIGSSHLKLGVASSKLTVGWAIAF